MLDLYEEVLRDGRAQERAVPLVELASLLYDYGFSDDLTGILDLVSANDTLDSMLIPTENLILSCAQALLNQFGVRVDIAVLYQYPQATLELCQALTSDIEAFDDYEALQAIVESGEPSVIVLANLTAYVHGTFSTDYLDLVEDVGDKLLEVIRRLLTARQLAETDDLSDPKTGRVVTILTTYSSFKIAELFDDNGYLASQDSHLRDFTLETDIPNYREELAVAAAALAYLHHDEPYEALEGLVDQLAVQDGMLDKLPLYRLAGEALSKLANVEEEFDGPFDAIH